MFCVTKKKDRDVGTMNVAIPGFKNMYVVRINYTVM